MISAEKALRHICATYEAIAHKSATNPYELMADEGIDRWLSLCGYDAEKMSDFEKLEAYVDCVSLMPDNDRRKSFFEKAEIIFGEPVSPKLKADELWRRGIEGLLGFGGSVVDENRTGCGKRMEISPKKASVVNIPISRRFDLNLLIASIGKGNDKISFDELADRIIFETKQEKAPCGLVLDIENIDFRRGDHYHARLVYEKLVQGQCLGDGELECYTFWLLSFVLEKLSDSCVLYLNTGSNLTCARELVSYFEMRGLLPRTRIALTDRNADMIREICELCLLVKKRKITPDIFLSVEEAPSVIVSRLKELLEVYPTQMLRFGGVLGAASSTEEPCQYGKRIIAYALSKLVYDDERAEKILESLFDLSK